MDLAGDLQTGVLADAPADVMERQDLTPSGFLARVVSQVQRDLKESRSGYSVQSRGRLAKIWKGHDQSIHFEIALHARTNQLEIGLHFESDATTNSAFYREFDRCLLEIQYALGPSVVLEEWDRGWTRLYEILPLLPMESERVASIAARAREFVLAVQPFLDEIERRIPLQHPASRTQHRA